MADNRLMILPCEFDEFPCSSFTCDQPTREKYWVGNPYSGGLHNYPIFCKTCIDHLVNNLPADLSPTSASIEARLRKQLEGEFQDKLQSELAKQADAIRAEVTAKLVGEFTKPEVKDIPPAVEAVEEVQNDLVYRCLDCGDEFNSAAELEAHTKTHADEAPAPKRGRKKQ